MGDMTARFRMVRPPMRPGSKSFSYAMGQSSKLRLWLKWPGFATGAMVETQRLV